jgi:hypothetical protein
LHAETQYVDTHPGPQHLKSNKSKLKRKQRKKGGVAIKIKGERNEKEENQ